MLRDCFGGNNSIEQGNLCMLFFQRQFAQKLKCIWRPSVYGTRLKGPEASLYLPPPPQKASSSIRGPRESVRLLDQLSPPRCVLKQTQALSYA